MTFVPKKYVTVTMNLKQAEAVQVILRAAVEADYPGGCTNATRRRLDGVRRTLEAALREASKHSSQERSPK